MHENKDMVPQECLDVETNSPNLYYKKYLEKGKENMRVDVEA